MEKKRSTGWLDWTSRRDSQTEALSGVVCSPRGSYPAGLQHRHLLRPLFLFFLSPSIPVPLVCYILVFVFIMRMKLCFTRLPRYKFSRYSTFPWNNLRDSLVVYLLSFFVFLRSFYATRYTRTININSINTKAVILGGAVFDNLIFAETKQLA